MENTKRNLEDIEMTGPLSDLDAFANKVNPRRPFFIKTTQKTLLPSFGSKSKLTNVDIEDQTFRFTHFKPLDLSEVIFKNCEFENVTFEDITIEELLIFDTCTFTDTTFERMSFKCGYNNGKAILIFKNCQIDGEFHINGGSIRHIIFDGCTCSDDGLYENGQIFVDGAVIDSINLERCRNIDFNMGLNQPCSSVQKVCFKETTCDTIHFKNTLIWYIVADGCKIKDTLLVDKCGGTFLSGDYPILINRSSVKDLMVMRYEFTFGRYKEDEIKGRTKPAIVGINQSDFKSIIMTSHISMNGFEKDCDMAHILRSRINMLEYLNVGMEGNKRIVVDNKDNITYFKADNTDNCQVELVERGGAYKKSFFADIEAQQMYNEEYFKDWFEGYMRTPVIAETRDIDFVNKNGKDDTAHECGDCCENICKTDCTGEQDSKESKILKDPILTDDMVDRLNGLYLLLGDAAVKSGVNQIELCMELAKYASDSINKETLDADDYPNVQKFIEKLKERISKEDDTICQDRKTIEKIVNEWDKKIKKNTCRTIEIK